MEDFRMLTPEEWIEYAHMIPRWIMESAYENDTLEIWGMEDWGTPCGVAVLSRKPGVMELQHFYIDKEYRGSGRGGRFLTELVYYAYTQRADWFQVVFVKEQYPAMEKLLKAYPVQEEETEQIGSATCTLGELMQLKHFQGNCGHVRALSQCTEESLSHLYRKIVSEGLDLVELPLKKDEYLAEFCAVAMDDREPAGLLLVQKTEDGVKLPFMINFSKNVTAPIEMIRFAVQKGSEELSKDTKCHFAIVNETLYALLEKLGIRLKKRTCFNIELSYLEEIERDIDIHIDCMNVIGGDYGF